MNNRFRVWLKFNAVGAGGIGIQLAVLVLLTRTVGMDYLVATAIAVEAAVLHNFICHERWTWSERTKDSPAGRAGRLIRFHITNGFTSIGGNLVLMRLFVTLLGFDRIVSNVIAIAICSIANFWTSDRLVFPDNPALFRSRRLL
jgi:putative flippase GtrA